MAGYTIKYWETKGREFAKWCEVPVPEEMGFAGKLEYTWRMSKEHGSDAVLYDEEGEEVLRIWAS